MNTTGSPGPTAAVTPLSEAAATVSSHPTDARTMEI